tara:strand:- start:168 stop:530 length:363 start_codon:yes stop_codon:yes gene_type:complete
MTEEYKYTYKFSEQSVDVRYWEVQSDKKLTEEEMLEFGFSTDLTKEGSVHIEENVKATFIGTEFGDDGQIQIEQGEEDLIPDDPTEIPEQTTMTNLVIEQQEKEEDDSIIEDYHNWGNHG